MTSCCKTSSQSCPTTANEGKILESVQNYYGKVLSTSKDLKTSACTAGGRPAQYILDAIKKVPQEINDKFYGCGSPIPADIEGMTVLDLGCGAGRDCYIAAKLVGPKGKVIGIDMTDEQLSVSRKYAENYCKHDLGYPENIFEFKKGYIEMIKEAGIADGSVDLIMSNCVINLSPNKEAVINGAAQALKEGGELYFSDVYCDRRLPEDVKSHEVLWGECISGALYVEDFKRFARKAGFTDTRILKQSPIIVKDPVLKEILGEAKFYSILFRCFKLSSLETLCEDYGQVATYNGGILGSTHAYELDDHHRFITGKPMLVCGNTAAMVQETRLGKYFTVQGNRSVHFGLFPCGPQANNTEASSCSPEAAAGSGCGGGSCC